MKKLLLPLLSIFLFTSCQKQVSTDKTSEELIGEAANKQARFTVCHYDMVSGTSKAMEVPQNALAGHLSHGDLEGDCSAVLTTICNQDWMVRNLDVSTYRNGDPIPQSIDPTTWGDLTTGAWCYYENISANGTTYGKLYNWYAVNDSRGLAPAGWHIPSHAEWTTLENCLDAISPTGNVGGKMKEIGTTHWTDPNTGATNISGFTALPGGYRFIDGRFLYMSSVGFWWSSTASDTNNAWFRYLEYLYGNLWTGNNVKQFGLSVRCLRD